MSLKLTEGNAVKPVLGFSARLRVKARQSCPKTERLPVLTCRQEPGANLLWQIGHEKFRYVAHC
jgi:hypothetical protein